MHCKKKYLKCMKIEEMKLYQELTKCVYYIIIFGKRREKCDYKETWNSRYICLPEYLEQRDLNHGGFCIMNL